MLDCLEPRERRVSGGVPDRIRVQLEVRVPWLRDEVVGRPRLTDPLAGSMGHLVVVSAPPGFGKTTLLAQWAALDPRPFAFVSLESTENDPAELWSSIVYSLGQIHPSTDESVEATLGSQGGLAVESIVRRVAAELEQLEQPMVLVLDDLHAIKNPTCIESLASFVNHAAGPLTIALSTRADPVIPLGRLRASGDLIEIRAADLAFTDRVDLLAGSRGDVDVPTPCDENGLPS